MQSLESMSLNDKQIEHEKLLSAFEQNHQSFRSLNQQMWQIPLISMTLTGGLWFGVSKVETYPLFQIALLLLAAIGNAALFVVILRLRFVMERHLNWLQVNFASGFVSAKGKEWYNRPYVVRTSFQAMLVMASTLSLVLFITTISKIDWREALNGMPTNPTLEYYEEHATSLADGYEALAFEKAHPELLAMLASRSAAQSLDVLDIGAGTGRDAAWLADQGHNVLAVEPSPAMQRIGKILHQNVAIKWQLDALPNLTSVRATGQTFDLITLSAVWMHVPPEERDEAFQSLVALLKAGGQIYLTLRIGPEEPLRGIYSVSAAEVTEIASSNGMEAEILGRQKDLLGRANIRWVSMLVKAP